MKTDKIMLTLLRVGSIFLFGIFVMIGYSNMMGEDIFNELGFGMGLFIWLIPQMYFAWFYNFNN